MFPTIVGPTENGVPGGGFWGRGKTVPELSVAVQSGRLGTTRLWVPAGTVLEKLRPSQLTTGGSLSTERKGRFQYKEQ